MPCHGSHLPPRICCAGVGFFPVQLCSRVLFLEWAFVVLLLGSQPTSSLSFSPGSPALVSLSLSLPCSLSLSRSSSKQQQPRGEEKNGLRRRRGSWWGVSSLEIGFSPSQSFCPRFEEYSRVFYIYTIIKDGSFHYATKKFTCTYMPLHGLSFTYTLFWMEWLPTEVNRGAQRCSNPSAFWLIGIGGAVAEHGASPVTVMTEDREVSEVLVLGQSQWGFHSTIT